MIGHCGKDAAEHYQSGGRIECKFGQATPRGKSGAGSILVTVN